MKTAEELSVEYVDAWWSDDGTRGNLYDFVETAIEHGMQLARNQALEEAAVIAENEKLPRSAIWIRSLKKDPEGK